MFGGNMKKLFGIVVGALLIAFGVIYALNVFEVADIEFSLDGWWTLFIILPCLNGLISGGNRLGSFAGLCVGVLLLLAARDVFSFDIVWKLVVPIIVVLIGIKFITKSVGSPEKAARKSDGGDEIMAVFTSQNADYTGHEVKTAKIGAIFGGIDCNMKNANITDGCTIDLICVFGGGDILLPDDAIVKNNSFCLFGGISDKRVLNYSAGECKTVIINGFCMFGGADIK